MKHSDKQIQTLFGEVFASPDRLQDRRADYSPIEFKFSYINNTSVPITIRQKSGLSFVLPSSPSLSTNRLIVRMEVVIQEAVRGSVARFISTVNQESSPELKAMREAYEAQLGNYGRGAKIVLDYPMTLEQLKQYGGTVYHSDLDILISLLDQDEVAPHPYSEEGQRAQMVVGMPGVTDSDDFCYTIHMVDNTGKRATRFLNVGNKVYKVTAKKDPAKRNGIYIVSNRFVDGDQSTKDFVTMYYGFDVDEESLGLYRSYDEALHFGDLATGKKTDLAKLETQLSENKLKMAEMGLELQSAKEAHEFEMIEKNRVLKDIQTKHEAETLEATRVREKAEAEANEQRQKLKDHYEARSYQRKDDSESLKYIPAIVVGIGAVFMAFKTWF